MARTLFTGWRTVTPGACLNCGQSDDWHADGRGNILCSCQACPDCNELDAHAFHTSPCTDYCPECGEQMVGREPTQLDGTYYCGDCAALKTCLTCSAITDADHCPDCAADWALVATS